MSQSVIERALISVSDKTSLDGFARRLVDAGIEIFSSGGTRRHLEEAGVPAREIAAYTGFPELMQGRVKTLHPKVHGGILCRRDRADDMAAATAHGILPFDVVVVNLYPFRQTVARLGVTDAEVIEQIDIGGPALVRAAAKNHGFVTVVTSPGQYAEVIDQIATHRGTTAQLRRRLARQAFEHTAAYDAAIADYLADSDTAEELPGAIHLSLRRVAGLRYGENPHQPAALYVDETSVSSGESLGRQLHGKQLSYNNLLDLDSALAIVRGVDEPAVAVIKHNNPCGAAADSDLGRATERALSGDPQSAFGSVLGLNRAVDSATAEVLARPGLFVEAIIAPAFDPSALETLTTRTRWKDNVRLIEVGELAPPARRREIRRIEGGVLVQQLDNLPDPQEPWQVVTGRRPDEAVMADLRLAWTIVRYVKSNAILLVNGQTVVGVGAGQMSRVDSVKIAIEKAGDRAAGAVLASDAFFPFPDSIEAAAAAHIRAVIQPGGSRRDLEVVAACDQHHLAMVFTGRRHFKH